jgi:hypothetical protein
VSTVIRLRSIIFICGCSLASLEPLLELEPTIGDIANPSTLPADPEAQRFGNPAQVPRWITFRAARPPVSCLLLCGVRWEIVHGLFTRVERESSEGCSETRATVRHLPRGGTLVDDAWP